MGDVLVRTTPWVQLPQCDESGHTRLVGFNAVTGWRPDGLRAARRATRRAKGRTQAELAQRLKVSRETIGQWESARTPRPGRVVELSALLDVQPEDLADLGGLRLLRVKAGMTQLALANAADVSRSTVQAIEQGMFGIGEDVAVAYASALGLTVAVVLEAGKSADDLARGDIRK